MEKYKYWQSRILISGMVGYAIYYSVRVNFNFILPIINKQLHLDVKFIGLFLSIGSIIYGLGKFFFGLLSDRYSPRAIMSSGLIGAGICNIFMGFAKNGFEIGFLLILLNVFTSMGWSPFTRLIFNWVPKNELGSKWGTAVASHQIGSAFTGITMGIILQEFSWQWGFFLPAFIAIIFGFILYFLLRDNPKAAGLQNEQHHLVGFTKKPLSFPKTFKILFLNKRLLFICVGAFFLYIIKHGFFTWYPLYLFSQKGFSAVQYGTCDLFLQTIGISSPIVSGYFTDKVLKGARELFMSISMAAFTGGICLFSFLSYRISYTGIFVAAIILSFFIYATHSMSGLAAGEAVEKEHASAAQGLVNGLFAYSGAAMAGWPASFIFSKFGWNIAFLILAGCSFASAIFYGLSKKSQLKEETLP